MSPQVGTNYYKLDHGKIYKTDAEGTINYDETQHATNVAPIDLSITKGVASMLLIAILMFYLFSSLARSYSNTGGVPAGIGRFFEPIVLYIRDDIARPNIGEKKYGKYMNFLLTGFLFHLVFKPYGSYSTWRKRNWKYCRYIWFGPC